MSQEWVRSGRNQGRYLGECIDIESVLREIAAVASQHHWAVEVLLHAGDQKLLALTRKTGQGIGSVYLSAGIHGDEPAGPLAALKLIQEYHWPAELDVYFCPCLNPGAFKLNCRGNPEGIDLNRDYREPKTAEIRAHIEWLNRQPCFDFSLCLHEDWEAHGFYLYELNPDHQPGLADAMISEVRQICPIDMSPLIEGRPAEGGVIRPVADLTARPDWPEAFYLIKNKTRLSYTLEAPSDFPLSARVKATVGGVQAAIQEFLRLRTNCRSLVEPGLPQ